MDPPQPGKKFQNSPAFGRFKVETRNSFWLHSVYYPYRGGTCASKEFRVGKACARRDRRRSRDQQTLLTVNLVSVNVRTHYYIPVSVHASKNDETSSEWAYLALRRRAGIRDNNNFTLLSRRTFVTYTTISRARTHITKAYTASALHNTVRCTALHIMSPILR